MSLTNRKSKLFFIILPIACVVVSVLLFNANRIPPRKKIVVENSTQKEKIFTSLLEAERQLSGKLKEKWDSIKKNTVNLSRNERLKWQDSSILFWDEQNRPDLAAVVSLKKAESENNPKTWSYAGQRCYYAVKFIREQQRQKDYYAAATYCFEKVLKVEPNNINAKIDLASCLVEGSDNPMKGITLLKEIERTDSNNIRLQLSFGFFSAKSQQWDKAIRRFKKALELDPGYIEVHLHLADAYEQSGKTKECINELEKFVLATNDPMAKSTIQEYIQKLKKTNK